MTFPTSHLKTLAQEAAPGHEWSPECIPILDATGARAVKEVAQKAAARCEARGKKRVQPEDFQGSPITKASRSRKTANERYVEWLEEVNETLAQALRAAGVELPKLPPCPGVPQEAQ